MTAPYDRKVVPFERSAAFMRTRALDLIGKNDLSGALRLLRLAGEADPLDRNITLETAHVLSLMGCARESASRLLTLANGPKSETSALLPLARDRLAMGDPDGAERTMDLFLLASPQSAESDAVYDLEDAITMARGGGSDRKAHIAGRLCMRAASAISEGDCERAGYLCARAVAACPGQLRARALYAFSLAMAKNTGRALRQFEIIMSYGADDTELFVLLAGVLRLCGRTKESADLLVRAGDMARTAHEFRIVTFAFAEQGMHAQALSSARRCLEIEPCAPDMLHAAAAACVASGEPKESAAAYWGRLHEILPDDPVAAWYAEGHVPDEGVPYLRRLPASEALRRVRYLSDLSLSGADDIARVWKEDSLFREYLLWAVRSDNMLVRRLSLSLLALLPEGDVLTTLRMCMLDPAYSPSERMLICSAYRARGGDVASLLPPDTDPGACLLPPPDEMLSPLPAHVRRIIRFADDMLRGSHGINALPSLAAMWMGLDLPVGSVLTRTDSAGAALAWHFLRLRGSPVPLAEAADEMGVPARQLNYYVSVIGRALARAGLRDGETDKTDT